MDLVRDFWRGAVRLHVLHHAAEAEVSGAWLTAELARHGYRISPGTLYPLLHGLEAAQLLTSVRRAEAGRVRRWYRVTPAGAAALAQARDVLAELAGELLPKPTSRLSQRMKKGR